jgi:hypothetical protein
MTCKALAGSHLHQNKLPLLAGICVALLGLPSLVFGQTGQAIVIEGFQTNSHPMVQEISNLASVLPSKYGLQTTLILSTNQVQAGTPIQARVVVQNTGTQALQRAILSFGFAAVAFNDTATGTNFMGSSATLGLTNENLVALQPGQSVQTNIVIQGYSSIIRPGTYVCALLFAYHGGKYVDLATEPVPITIVTAGP